MTLEAIFKAVDQITPVVRGIEANTAKMSQDVAKRLDKIGSSFRDVGRMATAAFTLPLVGGFVLVTKAAVDFESSFAGVRKTVDATEPELAVLSQGLRNMAKEIPVTVNELNKIAEAAGQLGIKKEDILAFTRTMADLGVTTNLTADEAATATAQIQNIFGTAGKDVDRFGATLVALGNAGASTEKDIIEMAKRIAGAGNQIGLSQAQVLSFASGLSSIGINAEAGGSSISRVFLKINDAVAGGGKAMSEFARVSGMSAAAFKTSWEGDAATATTAFINGLGRLKKEGENVNQTLEGLVGKNIIIKDTLMRASGAGQLLNDALALGNKAWQENTALINEAKQRYETFASQLQVMRNKLTDAAITLGTALLPTLKDLIRVADPVIKMLSDAANWFAQLPAPVRNTALGIAALTAAFGPAVWVLGSFITQVGVLIKALPVLGAVATGAAAGVTTLKLALIGSGIGLAIIGIGILASEIYKLNHPPESSQGKQLSGLATELKAVTGAATTATGVISGLKTPLFLTADALNGPKGAAPAAALTAKELKELAKSAKDAARALEEQQREYREYYNWIGERAMEAYEATRQRLADEFELYKAHFARIKQTQLELINSFDPTKFIEPLKGAVAQSPAMWASAWQPMKDGFKGVLASLPQTLQAAFTGGGGIMGALKAIGVQIASVLTDAIGSAISKAVMGAMAGRAAGSVAGSVAGAGGAAAAGGAGMSAGAIGATGFVGGAALMAYYVWQSSKAAKERQAAWLAMRDEAHRLIAEMTPQVFAAMNLLGIDTDWVSKGGVEQTIATLTDMFAELEAKTTSLNDSFAPLLQSAKELGIRLPDSILLSIERFRDLGVLTEANAALFDQLAGAAEVDWRKMEEAAGRYGDWLQGELGPTFRQLKSDDFAAQIINDFDLLTRGGADVGAVLTAMTPKIQQLVTDSQELGVEIPANMKPWIEELIRVGKLTDAEGRKLDDLSEIYFADPIKTEFEIITQALEALIATLDRLGESLSNLPKPNLDFSVNTGGGSGGAIDSPEFPGTVTPIRGDVDPIRASDRRSRGGSQTIIVQNILDGRVISESFIERAGDLFALKGR